MKQVAAVIGAGFVGKAHIEALRRLPVPVRGTLVSSDDRSTAAARALGLDRAYKSVEEIASDREVTAVHICTPNYVHFEQAAKLMRAGKHVLCEKPLAMDSPRLAYVSDGLELAAGIETWRRIARSVGHRHALAGFNSMDHWTKSRRALRGFGHGRSGAAQTAWSRGVLLFGQGCPDG